MVGNKYLKYFEVLLMLADSWLTFIKDVSQSNVFNIIIVEFDKSLK